MIGRVISHYRIVDKIGEGGMGVVYLAEDTELERKVALKFLPPRIAAAETELARFRQEARAAAALDHPNICTIYEIESADDETFIAMAYVSGEELGERIARGPLPLDDVITFGIELCSALNEAHAHGVVHRDIKPSNVMISRRGHTILMDFGLAKRHGQTRLTKEGTTLGTVAYMSPEQVRGEDVDPRSDLWSLGAMLYEMVSGRAPFRGEHQSAVMYAIGNEAHAPLTSVRTDVPLELERIVDKLLAKEPGQRYQNAADLGVDLQALRRTRQTGPGAATTSRSGMSSLGREGRKGRRWVLPVAAMAAVAVSLIYLLNRGSTRSPGGVPLDAASSIAVLPLANLSGDTSNEFFVDGMTDELITQLAQIHSLKVISRTSVMRYKRSDQPIPEIGRALGVENVVEGSVLWAGDRVRITVQLIDAATDAHLWANSFDGELDDVLGLQRRVARAVAEAIDLELTPREQEQLAGSPAVDKQAHQLYLRARHHWFKRTIPDIKKSIALFEQATRLDSVYARAWEGLAQAKVVRAAWDLEADVPRLMASAREDALKALDLDPSLGGAHATLGAIAAAADWDWNEARRHFQRAVQLSPNDVTAHQWYAEELIARGHIDEAIQQIEVAIELDPLALILYNVATYIYGWAGDMERANTYAGRGLELDPDFYTLHYSLYTAYIMNGMPEKAITEWTLYAEAAAETEQDSLYAARLRALVPEGHEAYHREFLRQTKEKRADGHVSAGLIAMLYAALGEADSAITWLERGYEERGFLITLIAADQRYNFLDDDPRFQDILRRMDLVDARERFRHYRHNREGTFN